MSEPNAHVGTDHSPPASSVEDVMRAELAYGDATLGTVGPILGHLVLNHDHSLFSDEIVARVRAMLANVAQQLIDIEIAQMPAVQPPVSEGSKNSNTDDGNEDGEVSRENADNDLATKSERVEQLAQAIAANPDFLQHCHSLAIEFQLAQRLKLRNSLDPVLTPLLQAMIADKDANTASAAMATLAAQARFLQQQQRMVLPLAELPLELAQYAMQCWHKATSLTDEEVLARTVAAQRKSLDEPRSRLGLIRRLLDAMAQTASGGMASSLSIPHAGVSIFISALAAMGGTSREAAALTTNDRQMARLALTLRGAGLQAKAVEEQFHYLHPDIELPENFDTLRPDRARTLIGGAP